MHLIQRTITYSEAGEEGGSYIGLGSITEAGIQHS